MANPVFLDTSGQYWVLGATNDGRYTTTPVSAQSGAVASILLKDVTTGLYLKVYVAPNPPPAGAQPGDLLSSSGSATTQTQIIVNSPNGVLWGIQIANGYFDIVNVTCVASFLQMQIDLSNRLADPGMVRWVKAELQLYIIEALRTWNALTEIWNAPFVFTATQAQGVWYNLSTLHGSPRLRTVLDTDLYTIMEYHLLEPPSGGVWTGTGQFSISDFQGALQRRRDEMIQFTTCNLAQYSFGSTPGVRATTFPNTVLEPMRVRFMNAQGLGTTLTREDTLAWDSFEPQHLQENQIPAAWSVISEPPLSLEVDTAPNVAGSYDAIAIQSGPQFTPPSSSLMGVPDDWSWLAKWGALADLLGRESEATDRERAAYCLKRYTDGIKIMQASNWLLAAKNTLANIPLDTPSMREMDGYSPEWEDNQNAWPGLVTAGMDFVAPCPPANGTPVGVSVVVVGNAPIPASDTDCVQVLRDTYDTILDYAQVLAVFKDGGAEFAAMKDLEQKFYKAATANNKRIANLGLFSDEQHAEGKRQTRWQPRY